MVVVVVVVEVLLLLLLLLPSVWLDLRSDLFTSIASAAPPGTSTSCSKRT